MSTTVHFKAETFNMLPEEDIGFDVRYFRSNTCRPTTYSQHFLDVLLANVEA